MALEGRGVAAGHFASFIERSVARVRFALIRRWDACQRRSMSVAERLASVGLALGAWRGLAGLSDDCLWVSFECPVEPGQVG